MSGLPGSEPMTRDERVYTITTCTFTSAAIIAFGFFSNRVSQVPPRQHTQHRCMRASTLHALAAGRSLTTCRLSVGRVWKREQGDGAGVLDYCVRATSRT